MHIPDGFLSAPVAASYGAVSLLGIAAACHRLRGARQPKQSALLGVSAAFIFAAQMVSFPVAAGTSGHLVGGVLAVALLGLPSALIVMTAVLFVQCLVFGDGGVFALGANVFNMAFVGCIVGSCCYRLLSGRAPSPTRRVASLAFAAWCATVAAAASCAEQLALSGAASWSVVVPAALGIHALIGVGEAVITALIVSTVLRVRPDLLELESGQPGRVAHGSSPVRAGLGLALAVVVLLAPLAYAAPDGLSRVVQGLGFPLDQRSGRAAPLAEYRIPGLGAGALTTILSGCLGTVLLFGLCWLLALALVPRPRRAPATARAAAPVAVESSG
ncbi:MAG: energy-coupling factor ABC transporter permease [Polyangiaceae bacterium]